MFIWRLVLGMLSTLAVAILTSTRRRKLAVLFSIVFVAAIGSLAVLVMISQVEQHRVEQAAGKETVRWPSLSGSGSSAGPAAPWNTSDVRGPGAASPSGAAAPSPVQGRARAGR